MRPLELVVEGFRSYDARTVFDWRDRHLVGIVGPIGSGKSSILDAIAFALYGKTPVFERENKTLIREGCDHARVELSFAVDGQHWRVLRVLRRKGASKHALYRIDALDGDLVGEPEPLLEKERAVTERIERLLGLDFPAFNRSVLLAQNRFARFLEASPSERDRVLKGVFGFDRVDAMHAEARRCRERAEVEVSGLLGQRASLESDGQRLEAAQRALDDAAVERRRLEAAAPGVRELEREALDAEATERQAEQRLAALDGLARRMPDPEDVATRARAERAAADAVIEAEAEVTTARTALQEAETTQRVAWGDIAGREQLEEAARWADRLARHLEAEVEDAGSVDAARKALGIADRAVSETQLEVESAKHQLESTVEQLAVLRDRAAEATGTLDQVEAQVGSPGAIAQLEVRIEALDRARDDARVARRAMKEEEARRAEAERQLEHLKTAARRADDTEARAREAQATAVALHREAEDRLTALRQTVGAKALAEGLAVGDDCPICGRELEHEPILELPEDLEPASERTTRLEAARGRAESASREAAIDAASARQAAADGERARDEARRRYEVASQRVRTIDRRCSELGTDLTDRLGLGDPRERLVHAQERLRKASEAAREAQRIVEPGKDAVRAAEAAVQIANERVRSAQDQREAARQRLAEAERSRDATVAQAAEARTALAAIVEDERDPSARLDALRTAIAAAEQAVEAARQVEREALVQLDAARERRAAAQRTASEPARRLTSLAGALDLEVDETATAEVLYEQVHRGLVEGRQRATAGRDEASTSRKSARGRIRSLHEDLGLEEGVELDVALATVAARCEREQATIDALSESIARATALDDALEAAEARLRRFRQLADDLTGARFLRFLLDEERAGLAALASERFEMLSGGRYRFAPDGTFDVVDLANAEVVRRAETLSGGETFLASLALALALAELVTGSGGRLDAFFLDEGFGSLDEEHMDLAMEGIERLVTDAPDRLVTVVSHVAALRERIDDLIILDKDPASGATRVLRGSARQGGPSGP